jgi:hypothetical protein
MPQNFLDLQIFECGSCPISIPKPVKTGQSRIGNRMVQFFQTCQIWLSTTIFLGTLCKHTILDMYSFASLALELFIFTGMKWATFVKRSTMTQIESYPAWVHGNPTMKSIPVSSHFHSGILRGCSNPAGLYCSAFTRWQVSHRATYSVTSCFILYHQYQVFKSLYILVLLG